MNFTFNQNISIGDCINTLLLITAIIGALLARKQIKLLIKQKRADIIVQFFDKFYNDKDIQDIYYQIEYDVFKFNASSFPKSQEEKQVDKLLTLFNHISGLYLLGVIKNEEIELVKYMFVRVYKCDGISWYLSYLDSELNNFIPNHIEFSAFRKVSKLILNDFGAKNY
jgi:hypothetical protein